MDNKKNNIFFLKQDLFGGLTAGVVALPLGLAFGVSSGLGALAGLYGAIFVGFFASLFGGTPKQISGPTGPMTVIVALIFIEFNFRSEVVFFCIFVAGFIQILFGILKLGNLVKKIPQAVISGFMTGIGLIIIFLQLPVLLGLNNEPNVILSILKLKNFINYNIHSVIVSFVCLIGLFFIPFKISKIIPIPIIILFFGSLLSYVFFNQQNLIDDIPSGIPKITFYFPVISEIPKIIFYSTLLALLGVIDSLLTSIIADQITKDQHKPNKESFGQGIGNIISGLFGGLAGAGATMRTIVNINAGGQTKLSGMIHATVLLLIVLFLAPIAEIIPLSVLAAILIKVGIDIIDWDFFKSYKNRTSIDIITTLLVIVLTVFINLILAVFIGVMFYYCSKFFLKK